MQKVFGLYAVKTGIKIGESMQAEVNEYERAKENVKTNLNARRGKGSCKNARRVTWKECFWFRVGFEVVNTTPQMTRFRGAKVCSKWLQ